MSDPETETERGADRWRDEARLWRISLAERYLADWRGADRRSSIAQRAPDEYRPRGRSR